MLGRYQILKPLAKGGMAEVFLARTIGIKGFERHVVLKFIRVEHETNQKTIGMLLDEARLVAALHHRNIVQVHDVGESGGQYFFAMEYVHGEDGRALLRQAKDVKQQIPLAHILTIITAAAAGLHYAHEMRGPDRKPLGIVHRDISPGNILIGFDGGVKVVDFGIAKTDREREETNAGEMKGKVGYMSPEQCKALPLDRRTDVYMLGIVLYELCTVRRLFKGENRFQTMQQIVEGNVAPPSRYRKDLPDELEQIIMKALATDPVDRYQTADDLRLVLEAFAQRTNITISPSKLSDYMKELFGERIEPWFVDPPPPDPTPDEMAALERISEVPAPPATPAARASEPAITPPPVAPIETSETKAAVPDVGTDDTPMAWQSDLGAGKRKRTLLVAIGGVVAVGAIAAVVLMRGGDDKPRPAQQPVVTTPADAGTAVTTEPARVDAGETAAVTTPDASVDEADIEITTNKVDAGVPVVVRPPGGRPPGGRPPGGRPTGGGAGSGSAAVIKTDKPTGPDLDSPFPTD
jgi:serine/threonine protein kinase